MEKSNTNAEFPLLTTPKRKRKSNAEYCKKYRSKKAGRQTESVRVSEYRRKIKDSPTKLLAAREKERKGKMLYRKKKSEATDLPDTPRSVEKIRNSLFVPFKKPQSLGKTMQRLVRNLPSSPHRQNAVVSGLAKRIGVNLMGNFEGALENTQSSRGISKETIDLQVYVPQNTPQIYMLHIFGKIRITCCINIFLHSFPLHLFFPGVIWARFNRFCSFFVN